MSIKKFLETIVSFHFVDKEFCCPLRPQHRNLNTKHVSLLLYIRNAQTNNSPHYTYIIKIIIGIKKDRQLYLYKSN